MKKVPESISTEAMDQIFREARTHSAWLDRPVKEETLHEIYNLVKFGPTSANSSPLRIVFVHSTEAKEKLLTTVLPGNIDKTRSAPVTAIFAWDSEFHEKLPQLFPHADARSWFAGNAELIRDTAVKNSSLQAAYFMIAARSLGLDCGPMGGFDNAKVDQLFLQGTTWKSSILCNLGYGDHSKLHPRLPRLSFQEACKIV